MLCTLCLCASCDDGRIPEKVRDLNEKGRTAQLEADLSGVDSWSKNYSVVFAGFTDDGTYAEISKDIKPDANGHVSLALAGIPDDVTKLEVCVINSIRKRIATFYTINTSEATEVDDTLRISPTAPIAVSSMYATIQTQIFDKQCAQCHSGSAWAASLNLNDGVSYDEMLNVASSKVAGKARVTPGDADNSVLYEALATSVSLDDGWKHNHSNIMATDYNGLKLIKDWIDDGAKR